MKSKNKVVSFLLSLLPGLGQIYLGYLSRGLVYLILEIFSLILYFFGINDYQIRYNNGLLIFMLIVIVLTWIISIVDSMILRDRVLRSSNSVVINNDIETIHYEQPQITFEKAPKDMKKIISMILSIIPGVGHMYLGMLVQGIQLMSIFLLCFYLNSLLQDSVFMYFVPIVWFYSLFDVYKKVSSDGAYEDNDVIFISWIRKGSSGQQFKYKVVGIILLLVGIAAVVNRIIADIISNFNSFYWLSKYIQIGFLAALFIAGGIKLLKTYHKMDDIDETDSVE